MLGTFAISNQFFEGSIMIIAISVDYSNTPLTLSMLVGTCANGSTSVDLAGNLIYLYLPHFLNCWYVL